MLMFIEYLQCNKSMPLLRCVVLNCSQNVTGYCGSGQDNPLLDELLHISTLKVSHTCHGYTQQLKPPLRLMRLRETEVPFQWFSWSIEESDDSGVLKYHR